MHINYIPTDVDIQWAGNTVAVIKDGGVLAYPATKMVYKVDHTNKKLILQNVSQLDNYDSAVIHAQSKIVFAEVGYTVTEKGAA